MRTPSSVLSIIVGCLAVLFAAGCRTQPVRDPPVVENSSVVTVVGWSGAKGGGGTGFYVAPDQIVTCRHVVVTSPNVFVRLADTRQIRVLGVLDESAKHDLVLLQVEPVLGVAPLTLAPAEPFLGDELTAVGSQALRAQTVSRMVVTGVDSEEGQLGQPLHLHVHGAIAPGSSGCPLIDAQGRVSGVASGYGPEDLDWVAVPARYVRALTPGPLRPMKEWGEATAADPLEIAWHEYNRVAEACFRKDFKGALRESEALLPTVLALPAIRETVCKSICECLVALGRPDDAVARMRALVSHGPGEAWRHSCLGKALDRLARREEALAAFREASRLEPKDPLFRAGTATALASLGRHAEAEAEARAALALKPGWTWALHAIGSYLAKEGKDAEALPFLEEAARLSPRDARVQSDLGLVLVALHRMEAVAAFETAVGLDPSNLVAHANLALCYASLGDHATSQRELATLRLLDAKVAAEIGARLSAPPPAR